MQESEMDDEPETDGMDAVDRIKPPLGAQPFPRFGRISRETMKWATDEARRLNLQ